MRKTLIANIGLGIVIGMSPVLLGGYALSDWQWWAFVLVMNTAVSWHHYALR